MIGPSLRSTLLVLIVAVPLAVAAQSSPVAAACFSGALPSASVTGIVVSTSVSPDLGVIANVQADDGTIRQVRFWGRNPTNRRGSSENTVEDAWAGSLPGVGGRYRITGDFNGDDQPITVSNCAQPPSVEVLSAPPATSDGGGMPTAAVVLLAIGTGIVVAALALLLRRPSEPASA